MPLPVQTPLNERIVWAYLADSSASSSAFAYAPCKGRIVKMGTVIYNAITSADTNFTAAINGTAITGAAWVIANSGSAAGDADSAVPTAANVVKEGDTISWISDGGGSTTCPTNCFAIIRMDV